MGTELKGLFSETVTNKMSSIEWKQIDTIVFTAGGTKISVKLDQSSLACQFKCVLNEHSDLQISSEGLVNSLLAFSDFCPIKIDVNGTWQTNITVFLTIGYGGALVHNQPALSEEKPYSSHTGNSFRNPESFCCLPFSLFRCFNFMEFYEHVERAWNAIQLHLFTCYFPRKIIEFLAHQVCYIAYGRLSMPTIVLYHNYLLNNLFRRLRYEQLLMDLLGECNTYNQIACSISHCGKLYNIFSVVGESHVGFYVNVNYPRVAMDICNINLVYLSCRGHEISEDISEIILTFNFDNTFTVDLGLLLAQLAYTEIRLDKDDQMSPELALNGEKACHFEEMDSRIYCRSGVGEYIFRVCVSPFVLDVNILEFSINVEECQRQLESLRVRGQSYYQVDEHNRLQLTIPHAREAVEMLETHDQSTQTLDDHIAVKESDFESMVNQKLSEENEALRSQLREKDNLVETIQRNAEIEKLRLENELLNLKDELRKTKNEKEDAMVEVGRLSFEKDANENKAKQTENFQKIFPPKSVLSAVLNTETKSHGNQLSGESSTQGSGILRSSPSRAENVAGSRNDQTKENTAQHSLVRPSNILVTTSERNDSVEHLALSVSVEETSNAEQLSLANKPSSSVMAHVYHTYKLLLISMIQMLLTNDIIKLKEWAYGHFSIDTNLTATEVIFQMDAKGIINASDLSVLRTFFESILRFDLAYLIDEFIRGDYANLTEQVGKIKKKHNMVANRSQASLSSIPSTRYFTPVSSTQRGVSNGQLPEGSHPPDGNNATYDVSNQHNMAKYRWSNPPSTSRRRNTPTSENSEDVDRPSIDNTRGNDSATTANVSPEITRARNEMEMSRSRQSPSQSNIQSPPTECNHSGPLHPHGHSSSRRSHNGRKQEDRWLCNHYKRRCMVKFDCCNKFWPCHRCHNEKSTCGRKKLKSRDTKMVKCNECGKEQQFGENGQFCVSCNTKFADFYCGLCKHLTGMDDHPYHCEKCGICRIHGDRSFHCDVCGVCLDVQLRGNHKCREGSAHDNCGICLEDAFSGCQILPCSHKVHKECATQMIQSGMTRCPICRESFAHKLQRKPTGKTPTWRR